MTYQNRPDELDDRCLPQYSALDNSLGHNPCRVARYLIDQCDFYEYYALPALDLRKGRQNYPVPDTDQATVCLCSMGVYNLVQACAACQQPGPYNSTLVRTSFPEPLRNPLALSHRCVILHPSSGATGYRTAHTAWSTAGRSFRHHLHPTPKSLRGRQSIRQVAVFRSEVCTYHASSSRARRTAVLTGVLRLHQVPTHEHRQLDAARFGRRCSQYHRNAVGANVYRGHDSPSDKRQ